MRKVILCVFALLAILFGAVLGILYPLQDLSVDIMNDDSIPFAPKNQPSLSTSTPAAGDTEVVAHSSPADYEVNDFSQPPTNPTTPPVDSDVNQENPTDGVLGHLILGNQSVNIFSGIDEETLKNGPGWMPESALPGDAGMSVILGHRNRNHLKIIENVQVDDEINFCYLDGRTISYSVTDIQIFENSADWVLPQPVGNMLVIVTCYPFRYSGSAPGKFQIICQIDKD